MQPVPAVGSSAVLRQLNSSAVLRVLMRASASLRLAELARKTALSRPTVETVIEGLAQQGWVIEDESADSTSRGVGRPARQYQFNARAGYVLGVDIGANAVAVCLADLRGDPVATVRHPIATSVRAAKRMAAVNEAVGEVLRLESLAPASILAVTIGTPGTVSPERQHVGISPAIPGWPESDIAAAVRDVVTCEIDLENDANLALVAERARGVAQSSSNVLFLLLGERLGAGVLVNDALVRGRDGAAGEIGYVAVPGLKQAPAGFGPLESRVNASALVDLGRRALVGKQKGRLLELCSSNPDRLTAENITLAASEGDSTAVKVLRTLATTLAAGIAPALLTLNPELLVLGGGISRAGQVLADLLVPQIKELVLFPPDVRLSALGSDAVLVGAVHQAATKVREDVLAAIVA